MKATMEFVLPDEQSEFLHAVYGSRFAVALFNLNQSIRSIGKHETFDNVGSLLERVSQLRTMLREELEETNWED